jgi:hypothetical protein
VAEGENRPHRVNLTPATEHNEATPLKATKAVSLDPATERDEAQPLTGGTLSALAQQATGIVTGPGEPQAGTIGESVGVLGWLGTGFSIGYGVGQSLGDVPGAVAGAAVGGLAACATIRWRPARERAFKFIRWLGDESRGD